MWRKLRGERGSVLVETALALQVFLFFAVATADFGLGYANFISMSNAAREGARWISLHPTDKDGAIERIVELIETRGLQPGDYDIDVSPNKTIFTTDDLVEVTITYNHELMFGAVPSVSTLEFRTTATMPVLYEPLDWEY